MATVELLLMTMALAVQPIDGTSSNSPNPPAARAQASTQAPAALRTPQQLREAVRAALKTAATSEGAARVEAARQLALLFDELQHDTQMVKDDRINLAGVIRSRLQKMDAEAKAAIARQQRNDPAHVAAADRPAGADGVLGQQLLPPGGKGAAGANGGNNSNKQADYGQQLIDVIQGTIAPGSWDVNGGNGSIKFFPGLNVMVIRNTAENQEDLVDVLNALRKQ